MPRLSDSLPKYRKHRATGQAVVTLNGRDFYLGPYGTRTSRLEYDRLIGEWLAGGRRSLHKRDADLTIAELCIAYLKYARTRYVKNGRLTGEWCATRSALRYMRAGYMAEPAAEFGPLALKAVRLKMIERNLAVTSINQHIGRIRRMFRWGVAEELICPDVYQALVALPGLRKGRGEARETEPVVPVEDATVKATLLHLPEVPGDMVWLQRLTGCRPAEICIMRPCDIDRSGDVWKYRPKSHKSAHWGRERIVFIGPAAQGILLRYLARDAEAYCFMPRDSESKRRNAAHALRVTPISCGDRPGSNRRRRPKRKPGDHYTVDSYRRAIHRACDAAFPPPGELAQRPGESVAAWRARLTKSQQDELGKWQSDHRWSPNQLRHTAATEIRRQFGLEAASTILGHAKADVTQVYAERDYAKAAEVARLIG